MINFCFDIHFDISFSCPLILQGMGQNNATFGLILAFEAL